MIERHGRTAALLVAAFALAGCAVPEIDRFMLQSERAPVRLQGTRGPLTHAESEKILAELRRKSPGSDILLQKHVAIEEAIAGNPLTVGNQVQLLEDGPQTYRAMLDAIRSARQQVHMESYIFEADDVGREFAAALVERRRAGVPVRLIVDGVGSIHTPPEFLQGLRDAGVEVAVFNPVSAEGLLKKGFDLQQRDHRKLLVVDGRIAFLGGINISGVYTEGGIEGQKGGASGSEGGGGSGGVGGSRAPQDKPFSQRPWRDTQVRIEGPVVHDFQRSFLAMWARVQKSAPLEGTRFYPQLPPAGSQLVRAIEGSPQGDRASAVYLALISAVESAEKKVWITMAYFVPHDALLDSLTAAARRGVDVRIILPSRTDNWLVLNAGRAYYEDLLEAGVRIYERKNRLLHSKTASVDGVWATVGSTNLDWRSLAYNEELNAVVLGPGFADQLDAAFDKDIALSTEITREAWSHRSLADRAREAIARAWALAL